MFTAPTFLFATISLSANFFPAPIVLFPTDLFWTRLLLGRLDIYLLYIPQLFFAPFLVRSNLFLPILPRPSQKKFLTPTWWFSSAPQQAGRLRQRRPPFRARRGDRPRHLLLGPRRGHHRKGFFSSRSLRRRRVVVLHRSRRRRRRRCYRHRYRLHRGLLWRSRQRSRWCRGGQLPPVLRDRFLGKCDRTYLREDRVFAELYGGFSARKWLSDQGRLPCHRRG